MQSPKEWHAAKNTKTVLFLIHLSDVGFPLSMHKNEWLICVWANLEKDKERKKEVNK